MSGAGGGEDGVADPCLRPDGKSLPFAAGDAAGKSCRGHEVAPGRRHPTIQLAAQALGASTAGALQSIERGWERQILLSDRRDLHSFEPSPRPNRVA